MPRPTTPALAQVAVLISAVLWGTLWIPMRQMHAMGPGRGAATAVGFLVPLALLLPVAVARGRRTLVGVRALGPAGLCLALGIALYAEGVVRGRIAPVVLLFYLTPVWSTLLARLTLGVPISGRRLAAIGLGLAGMAVVFGGATWGAAPDASGAWMGLAAGFAWAVAIVRFHGAASRPLFDRVFVHFVFLGPIFFLVTLLPGGGDAAAPGFDPDPRSLSWLLALALVWMLPVVALTVYGARHVEPGRFAILLMFEVAVGLSTAALLTDEPFGLREIAGASLVLGAIGTEIRAPSGQRRRATKRP